MSKYTDAYEPDYVRGRLLDDTSNPWVKGVLKIIDRARARATLDAMHDDPDWIVSPAARAIMRKVMINDRDRGEEDANG